MFSKRSLPLRRAYKPLVACLLVELIAACGGDTGSGAGGGGGAGSGGTGGAGTTGSTSSSTSSLANSTSTGGQITECDPACGVGKYCEIIHGCDGTTAECLELTESCGAPGATCDCFTNDSVCTCTQSESGFTIECFYGAC